MKPELKDTLDGFVRHAEHYGTEEVFETAVDSGMNLWDLGRLALRLQNLDPQWKLTRDGQKSLVQALLYWRVVNVQDAARMAGVATATAREWYDELEEAEESPDLALQRASAARFEHLQPLVREPAKRR